MEGEVRGGGGEGRGGGLAAGEEIMIMPNASIININYNLL